MYSNTLVFSFASDDNTQHCKFLCKSALCLPLAADASFMQPPWDNYMRTFGYISPFRVCLQNRSKTSVALLHIFNVSAKRSQKVLLSQRNLLDNDCGLMHFFMFACIAITCCTHMVRRLHASTLIPHQPSSKKSTTTL